MSRVVDVYLANPLPSALAHYELALRETLGRVGIHSELFHVPAVEGFGLYGKAKSALETLRLSFSPKTLPSSLVRLWPSLGIYDLLVWSGHNRQISACVLHDPVPLRKQFGFGRLAKGIIKFWPTGWLSSVISHSRDATEEITKLRNNLHIVEALHPIRSFASHVPQLDRRPVVLVAGQFKAARDLEILTPLGSRLRSHGFETRIVGRGWPAVEGWSVVPRFLSEAEIERELSRASVVVVPYYFFFQSGIMIRALENGAVPVAPINSFSESVLGSQATLCIAESRSVDAWFESIIHANLLGLERNELFEAYQERCDASWVNVLSELQAHGLDPGKC